MTNITLLYDLMRWEEKQLLLKAEEKNVKMGPLDIRKITPVIDEPFDTPLGDVCLQRGVSFYRGLYATAFLEYFGHRVINTFRSLDLTGNKLLTSLELSKRGIPTPRTGAAFDVESGLNLFSKKFYGKAVIKPVTGSWGRMIALLNDRQSAEAVLNERSLMHPIQSITYLQEFVNKPGRDIRIIVAGRNAIAGMYRYQVGDEWRTNAAIGGRVEALPHDPDVEELAIKSTEFLDPGIYGVDIMETDRGYLVHEINGTMEFKGVTSASGVDVAGEIIDFILSDARK